MKQKVECIMVEGTLNLAFVMFTLTEALSKAYEMLT